MGRWFIRFFFIGLAVLSGAQLFILKYRVLEKEEELKEIHQQILDDSREIYILEGELALANDPVRLKRFVEAQGTFKSIQPAQIMSGKKLPDVEENKSEEEEK